MAEKVGQSPQTIDPKSFFITCDSQANFDEVSCSAGSLLIACFGPLTANQWCLKMWKANGTELADPSSWVGYYLYLQLPEKLLIGKTIKTFPKPLQDPEEDVESVMWMQKATAAWKTLTLFCHSRLNPCVSTRMVRSTYRWWWPIKHLSFFILLVRNKLDLDEWCGYIVGASLGNLGAPKRDKSWGLRPQMQL